LEEKKGEDILLLDIHEIASFTDFFIICSGSSDRMLGGLADGVLEKMKATHGLLGQCEGRPEDGWVLIDYGDVIIHLFSPDQRNYYRLEDLWERGRVLLRLQ
jgi:ribosome-associated protein